MNHQPHNYYEPRGGHPQPPPHPQQQYPPTAPPGYPPSNQFGNPPRNAPNSPQRSSRRTAVIILGIIAALAIVGGGGYGIAMFTAGNNEPSADTDAANAAQDAVDQKPEFIGEGPDFPGRRPTDISGFSDDGLTRGGLYIEAHKLEYYEYDETLPPALCAVIEATNNTDAVQALADSDFVVVAPDGAQLYSTLGLVDGEEPLWADDFDPDTSTRGYACFGLEGRRPAGQFLLAYVGNIFGGERMVWINEL